MDLFKDIIHSILVTKKDLSNDQEFAENYKPFVVNRALSNHVDCILFANEMNRLPNIDNILQYHFYINSIRGMKRKFQPWIKKDKNDVLDAVKEYYQINNAKALDALRILSPDQLEYITRKTEKGGADNVEHRRHGGGDAERA